MKWLDPSLTLKWGPYVRPSPDDETKTVTLVGTALTAGVVTKRSAVEKVRGVFGIEDVDAYLETLETEAEKKQEKAIELAQQSGPPMPTKKPSAKPAAKEKPE